LQHAQDFKFNFSSKLWKTIFLASFTQLIDLSFSSTKAQPRVDHKSTKEFL